ncbi:MAG: hypothetical protein HZB68_05705 [Candidatus Aenigmarchaeota archaeon]|nr:hypothetical protein [Candidatus Aenigmarchaeota archaeon]
MRTLIDFYYDFFKTASKLLQNSRDAELTSTQEIETISIDKNGVPKRSHIKRIRYDTLPSKYHKELSNLMEFKNLINFLKEHADIAAIYKGPVNEWTLIWDFVLNPLSEFLKQTRTLTLKKRDFIRFSNEIDRYLKERRFKVCVLTPIIGLEGKYDKMKLFDNLSIRRLTINELEELFKESGHFGDFVRSNPEKLRFAVVTDAYQLVDGSGISVMGVIDEHKRAITALRLFDGSLASIDCKIHYAYKAGFAKESFGFSYIEPTRIARGNIQLLHKKGWRNFQRFWKRFSEITKKHAFVDIAVRRLDRLFERTLIDDIIIDSMIGIEALFVESSGELSYKISTRAALLLEEMPIYDNGEGLKSRRLFEMLKTSYNIRSQIVHGGDVAKEQKEFTKKYGMDVSHFLIWCLYTSLTILIVEISRTRNKFNREDFYNSLIVG